MCVFVAASQRVSGRASGGSIPWNSRTLPHQPALSASSAIFAGVEVALEVGHHAGRPGQEHDRRAVERGVEQERDRRRVLGLGGQEAHLLEIRPLAGRQTDQIADPFVERPVRPGAEQDRHLGGRVAHVVINMPKLVMGGAEPLVVGLDRHQAADVVAEVDVPGAGVAVLLAARLGVGRVQVRLGPEAGRQLVEAQRRVEPLGLLGNELARAAL